MHVSQINDENLQYKIHKVTRLFGNSKDATEFK